MLKLSRQQLDPEAYWAYLTRLPGRIEVDWEKEDSFIIGKVRVDGASFLTQARNADEFIRMVNEGVLVMYDTPKNYIDYIQKHQNVNYLPPQKTLEELLGSKSESRTILNKQLANKNKLAEA